MDFIRSLVKVAGVLFLVFVGLVIIVSVVTRDSSNGSAPKVGADRDDTGTASTAPARNPYTAPPPQPAAPTYELELLASNGYDEHGYNFVEGQVKNVSGQKLEHVEAIATWYTADGEMVKTASALIDFNPILAGQTSTFKTITSGNPAMKRYTVSFKRLMGGSLEVKDSRKR